MSDVSVLAALMKVIDDRRQNPPSRPSYVVDLLRGGVPAIGAKVVEEAAEVVEAAAEPGTAGQEHLVREVADLVFHAMVLLSLRELDWSQVEAELGRRFGISGIEEKRMRNTSAS
jgi:phosphoribosyl-ATP pyrophosphohydrolase